MVARDTLEACELYGHKSGELIPALTQCAKLGVTMDAWSRLPNESAKAYSAFLTYCELDSECSIVKVSQKVGKNPKLLERWSARHRWQERVREYDGAMTEVDFAEAIRARMEMRHRHRRIAKILLAKVEQAAQRISAKKLGPSAAARLFGEAFRAERLALGESDETFASVTINVQRAPNPAKVEPK